VSNSPVSIDPSSALSPPGAGLRDRKKLATRLAISNVATQLFVERGFEAVSVADIANAAQVSRKTVFNYFPRKEDLVFDREDDARELVRRALAARADRPPVAAVQALMHDLLEGGHPIFAIGERATGFWRMVAGSPTLTTRARELQVSLGDDLAALLAAAAARPRADPDAHLAAAMLMASLVVAYGAGLRAFAARHDPIPAFAAVLRRGFTGIDAALAGTGYV
jgi:AcrR family transcriptional regulator